MAARSHADILLFDNTAGNLNINFNMTVLDASISANASVRVRGQLNLIHALLGG